MIPFSKYKKKKKKMSKKKSQKIVCSRFPTSSLSIRIDTMLPNM